MKTQLIAMLQLQDAMNSKVHSDWRSKNFQWYRAIWVECAELMDHFGWKWWKKQETDYDQVVLELVDVWHFGLSMELMTGKSLEDCASNIAENLVFSGKSDDFRDDLEAFASATLARRRFDIPGFGKMMAGVDLSFDTLYRRYVGKNVLNFFRQDHGYKDGSYQKVWHGKEDNEHLMEILSTLDAADADFKDQLYRALASLYPK